MTFGIGIPTVNAPERLLKLLQSIQAHTKRPHQIHVIDDGSSEDCIIYNRQICSLMNVRLEEHRSRTGEAINLGISATWNHLTRALDDCDIVALINDDIEVVPDWDEALIGFLERNPQAGMVSLPEQLHEVRDYDKRDVPIQSMSSEGYCFAFRVEDWENVGFFSESYRSFYEEIDFGFHLVDELGRKNYILPEPAIQHVRGASFADNPHFRPTLRMELSRLMFEKKWGRKIKQMEAEYAAMPVEYWTAEYGWRMMEEPPEIVLRKLSCES